MALQELLKFCEEIDCLNELKIRNKKNIETHKQKLFYECCLYNKLELAKWLYSHSPGDIDVNYIGKESEMYENSEHLLTLCGEYNYIEMGKWLVSIGGNLKTPNSAALYSACAFGNLELAQVFYANGAPLYYYKDYGKHKYYSAFYHACINNQHEIASWLYTVYDPTENELRLLLEALDGDVYLDSIQETKLYKWIKKLYSDFKN